MIKNTYKRMMEKVRNGDQDMNLEHDLQNLQLATQKSYDQREIDIRTKEQSTNQHTRKPSSTRPLSSLLNNTMTCAIPATTKHDKLPPRINFNQT